MIDNKVVIVWDRPKLERFKVAWAKAPGDGDAEFNFDGHPFVKSYAEYLIEYLDKKIPSNKRNPN